MATEIIGNLSDKALGGGNAKQMAKRGLQMLKDLVAPTQTIEDYVGAKEEGDDDEEKEGMEEEQL